MDGLRRQRESCKSVIGSVIVPILQALVAGLSCRHSEMWLLKFEND
jgi:hypothetical protein